MADDSREVPVFMPPLAALLLRAEQLKGAPLTEEEVCRIRDEARTRPMRREVAAQLDASRGYRDIDPDNCWEDWVRRRDALGQSPPGGTQE